MANTKGNHFNVAALLILVLFNASIGFGAGIKGYIDSVIKNTDGSSTIRGWACDQGVDESILVHIYLGGQAGVGKFYKSVLANVANEAAVNTSCATSRSNHRFVVNVGTSDMLSYGGQFVYIHGISLADYPNLLLNNSGRYPLVRNFTPPVINTCSDALIQSLFIDSTASVFINCNLNLKSTDVVRRPIIVQGMHSSNVKINCGGATLNRSLLVQSYKWLNPNTNTYEWQAPTNVQISNCKSLGSVRVSGMGTNGEDTNLTTSSRQLWHTERAQFYAPSNITFSNISFLALNTIAIYLSPGVHHTTIQNSVFAGTSPSVAIYMDAESGYNKLLNNSIQTDTSVRELVAVDGSAHNLIQGNFFSSLDKGGVYLYRNCGEGGNIRHQTPSYNTISNNQFYYNSYRGPNPSVWLSARNGNRSYCSADAGYPFGSSANDRDLAMYNTVSYNTYSAWFYVRVDEVNNSVYGNAPKTN